MTQKKKTNILIYAFMAPAILFILFVYMFPFIASIIISLTDWNGITHDFNFIGLKNYAGLFKEKNLLSVLYNNLRYFIFIVAGQNILGVILAVLLNGKLKGQNLLRAAIFLPTIICTVAVGFIWSLMLDPFNGIIPAVFKALNIKSLQDILWLGDSKYAIYSIIVTNIWQWTGYNVVIYLAGLQSIPDTIVESARIDGASSFQSFFHITLPMLAPSITINIIVTSIGTLKIYDLPVVMTNGGPGHSTESLAIMIYKNAFTLNKMGYGTALSLVLFFFVLIISIIQFVYLKHREDDAISD